MSAPAAVNTKTVAVLAQFATADQLLSAARAIRDAGYTHWDCHTPFPLHGLDRAMGIRRTKLPWLVLGGGLLGLLTALLMQLWMNGVSYPLVISDKPIFSVPANIPIAFELTVLFSAFGAFFGMLALNNLPLHYHPLYNNPEFRRATNDGFFISIEAKDERFDPSATIQLLNSLGARTVQNVEEME